jgi:hypothetical protein
MASNPCIVTADTVITWDHSSQRVARGTIVDIPPGSALEAAYCNTASPVYTVVDEHFYGDSNLTKLTAQQADETFGMSGGRL